MTRIIRPIGPVTDKLKAVGFRQYAAIFVDGKQVERAAILSLMDGGKLKFVGHYIDGNGEVHKTAKFIDMKRAAARLVLIIDSLPAIATAATPDRRHSSPATVHSIGAEIMCKGCGTRHSDDTLCPE